MISEALQFLAQQAVQANGYYDLENGRIIVGGKIVDPEKPLSVPRPDTVELIGLAAFVQYVNRFTDEYTDHGLEDEGPRMVTVEPGRVRYVTTALQSGQRFTFCESAPAVSATTVDCTMGLEEAVVFLRSRFVETEDRDQAIALLSRVKSDTEVNVEDDGVAQQVTVRDGLTGGTQAIARGVYTLAPYRTFEEIDQPESDVVVRLTKNEGGIRVRFVTADGDLWRKQAAQSIRDYLNEAITAEAVIL